MAPVSWGVPVQERHLSVTSGETRTGIPGGIPPSAKGHDGTLVTALSSEVKLVAVRGWVAPTRVFMLRGRTCHLVSESVLEVAVSAGNVLVM